MSARDDEKIPENPAAIDAPSEVNADDPLGSPDDMLLDVPSGVDRRTFLMRSAVVGATAVITGIPVSAQQHATLELEAKAKPAPAQTGTPPTPPLSPEL